MDGLLDEIIRMIYAAALDTAEWEPLCALIAKTIGAVAGFYAGLDVRHGRGAFWHTTGHDGQMAQLYDQHYLELDPTLAHIIKAPGRAFACSEYLSDADVAASQFHSEFLIPNGLRYVLSGVVSMQGSMISLFGFQRLISQAPFSRAETDILQRLIPHFATADKVAAKVNKTSDAKKLAMSLLDRMDYGIVFVSHTGQIRLTNQRAELWLEKGSPVRSHFGRLHLTVEKDNAALKHLIHAAGSGDAASAEATAIETTALDGAMRAQIVVLPINNEAQRHLEDDRVRAAIVISNVDQQRAMAPQLLCHSYGLTRAEMNVATGLASGKTQDDLANSLCVSLATIKTHTQHIYQKIGVSRQVELVRLVYGLPALF